MTQSFSNKNAADHLIVALDCHDLHDTEVMLRRLQGTVKIFKVGMELYNSVGPEIIELLTDYGAKVFLDLKFHDIPNTVAQAGCNAVRQGVWMYNLHISGGREMITETVQRSRQLAKEKDLSLPLIIGVTVLTSIDQTVWTELGWQGNIFDTVAKWAALGQNCGLNGVVCSPQEASAVRASCGRDFVIVTPGIRPVWSVSNEQKRITTPREAILMGSDYLVVGRPITKADDQLEAAQRVLDEMQQALMEKQRNKQIID